MFLCDSISSEHSHSIHGNQAYWRTTSAKEFFCANGRTQLRQNQWKSTWNISTVGQVPYENRNKAEKVDLVFLLQSKCRKFLFKGSWSALPGDKAAGTWSWPLLPFYAFMARTGQTLPLHRRLFVYVCMRVYVNVCMYNVWARARVSVYVCMCTSKHTYWT